MNRHERNRRLARMLSAGMIVIVVIVMCMFSSEGGMESSARSEQIARFLLSRFVGDYHQLSADMKAQLVDRLQMPIRKTAHMAEFALLGCWLYVFLHTHGRRKLTGALLALAGSVALACIDEGHQMFVGGRGPSLRDVGIDTIGAVIGIGISCWVTARLASWSKSRTNP